MSLLPIVSKMIEKNTHILVQKCLNKIGWLYVGFQESLIKHFQSYLSNRIFFVTLQDVFSDAALINYGVSEGSILGPLLFL